jgi:hypothetical protein
MYCNSNFSLPSIFDTNGKEWLKNKIRNIVKIISAVLKLQNQDISKLDIAGICLKKIEKLIEKLEKSSLRSVCHNDFWLHNVLFENRLISDCGE